MSDLSAISGYNSINAATYINPVDFNNSSQSTDTAEPLNSFDIEDQAIISSQAKLLNAVDSYNSGSGDEVGLALARINSENQVKAEVSVINSKKEMMDSILQIGE